MMQPLPQALARLFKEHDRVFAEKKLACKPGCSTCCTDRVIATSMEGQAVLSELLRMGRNDLLDRALAAAGRDLFRPHSSINGLARMCMDRQEPPVEEEKTISVCPLLVDGLCVVYPFRPIACRAQMSGCACLPGGAAEIDELSVTMNQVFFQAAEHLDEQGLSGNLLDVISLLVGGPDSGHLVKNRPIPGLLIFPEHFSKAGALLKKLIEDHP